ncbi:MAG TPA: M28 family peptidase [Chloroflexota bacterium]|nr:M28 family peptidase [Chloroflexota bacterium]
METIHETETMSHLRRLCEIGPRPIGSKANHAAAEYIRGVFRSAGLEVVDQTFQCPDWETRESWAEIEGLRLRAEANVFSPSVDVTAPTVALGSIPELERSELQGRIGVLYGDLAARPLTPKGCTIYQHERDQRVNRLLEEKRPLALITVSPRIGSVERVIEDWSLEIASATVPPEVGLSLLQRIGDPVRLRIVTESSLGYSCNVVADRPGVREGRIVICAHYDTKIETPGAGDDAAGIAAVLTLAHLLPARYPGVGLEFIAFSAEEYGASQDDTEFYVRCRGDAMGGITAAINMDLVGQRLGTTAISMMASSETFRDSVDALLKERAGLIWTEPWPESNHSTFALRGVPAVAINCKGITNLTHMPEDTMDWIGEKKLGEVVEIVSAIVGGLQDKSVDWTREARCDLDRTTAI